jgi:hypothetical protein
VTNLIGCYQQGVLKQLFFGNKQLLAAVTFLLKVLVMVKVQFA